MLYPVAFFFLLCGTFLSAHADGWYNSAWTRRQEISIHGGNEQLSSHNSTVALRQIPANMACPNGRPGVQVGSDALRTQPMIPAPGTEYAVGIDLGRLL